MPVLEGVIKFRALHRTGKAGFSDHRAVARLLAWRSILFDLGLCGQDPDRYGGAGFGNLSLRIGAPSAPRGRRPFLITGTQTGGVSELGSEQLCAVHSYDLNLNQVVSQGPVAPSSESMTHGAIYDLSSRIRCVVHVHSPAIWRRARELRLPTTRESVDYGTPEMALEVRRLYRDSPLAELGVMAMGGHEDGIIGFGSSSKQAAGRVLEILARARELGH
ncbi:MAG: class II aldolase/adducin family protein [Deltaproteobacteria bacterium]|nr:class II aldolase/adducin family protein [Deltaproteobacteria bacterium]